MNAITETLKPGSVIQNTYEIVKPLGEGGMGATFAGRNLATEHDVVIKVISTAFAGNARAVDMFKREANLLRTIQHDAVVRYETTLQDAQGRLYLVMELLEGHPLSWYIARRARLSPEDVLRLGRRLAGGLDAIAAAGTVHRDIAPDNIFVPDDDILSAKLIDFGLASNTVGTDKSIVGTDFVGKFSFCAPEQMGLFDGNVSPRTDAYALGLVLMKVAGLPVPGEGQGLAAGTFRREDLVIPQEKVSPGLHFALTQLLRADPEKRPSPITPVFEKALAMTGAVPVRSEQTKQVVGAVEKKNAQGTLLKVALAAACVIVVAGGFVWQAMQSDGTTGGQSLTQSQIGQQAIGADDPMAATRALMAKGDADSLNAALAALLGMGRDDAMATDQRIAALILAAEMTDPQTFDAAASPFPEPNPGMARKLYESAAALGSDSANKAAIRLKD